MGVNHFAPGRPASESYEIEIHGYTCDCGLSHHPEERRRRLRRMFDPSTSTGWVDGMETSEVRAAFACCYGTGPAGSGKGQDPRYAVFRRDAKAIGWRNQWEERKNWRRE